MQKRHAFAPTDLDRLESRVVLSQGMLTGPALVMTSTQAHPIHLAGTIKGFETPSPLASAIPGGLLLRGSGTVSPLGQAKLVGTLSIRSGEPTFYDGTETLSNKLGTIKVHIFGIVGGPTGPPAHLQYKIVSGTGVYHSATGKGLVVYDQAHRLTPGKGTAFSLTFGPPSPIVKG